MTVKQVSNVLNAQLDGGTHYQQQKSSAPALPEALLPLTQKPTEIHVDLSEAAKMRSKGGAMISNQDIDESDLPDMIKQLLKKLREIKQKLMAKITELQKVMNDTQLRADLRKQRVQMLQTEIMSLEGAYMKVAGDLADAVKTLSSDQQMQASALMMG